MIERYTRKAMGDLWSLENRFAAWLEVEVAVCEAWNRLGVIPDADLAEIRAIDARFTVGPATPPEVPPPLLAISGSISRIQTRTLRAQTAKFC